MCPPPHFFAESRHGKPHLAGLPHQLMPPVHEGKASARFGLRWVEPLAEAAWVEEVVCAAVGMPHRRVTSSAEFPAALDAALAQDGPVMIEVDMVAIGPFAEQFAGPPAGAAGSKP